MRNLPPLDWPFDDTAFRTFTGYPYTMRMAVIAALTRRNATLLSD
jgi:hypothetical protein